MGVKRLETRLVTAYAEERLNYLCAHARELKRRQTVPVGDNQVEIAEAQAHEMQRLLERLGFYNE